MIGKLVALVSHFVLMTIQAGGYAGVAGLMAIESACIPLPSELIMPFAGFLASQGRFNLWELGIVGALGCVLGSIPAYYLGLYGGRPLIEKYGKWVLLSRHDLDLADRLFRKHGEPVVFFARLLPVVRTFIAFPAGVSRMDLRRFVIYTFVGSFPWCLGLAYLGRKLGEHWETLGKYFHRFDALIGALIVLGIVLYVWRHLRQREA
ncbi:MAG: DedA family protein [Thermoanaerobaculia bacterium]